MKVTAFLIKYGEIAIKGKNRYMFEDALMKQIRHAMAPVGDFKVRKESGRIRNLKRNNILNAAA